MNHDAEVRALATFKRFLIDSEIPVRELAELAFANWIAARSFCADERERSEWALLADLILKRATKYWSLGPPQASAQHRLSCDESFS
jgi:hypothetical protein